MKSEKEAQPPRKTWHVGKFILLSAGLLAIGVLGLRYWEEASQKPRVIKAFADLIQDCTQEVYRVDTLWSMIESGQTAQSGYLNISHVDASILSNPEGIDMKLLQNASVVYDISRDTQNKKMVVEASYSLLKVPMFEAQGYVDTEQVIVRIPQLHNSYLRAQTENLKSQYEHSLLYTVLYNRIPAPDEEISIHAFPEKSKVNQSFADMVREFTERHPEEIKAWYQEMEVEKQEETVQMLVQNTYVTLAAYEVSVPANVIRMFYEEYTPETIKEAVKAQVSWQEESIPMIVYLDGKNQILRMDIKFLPVLQGEETEIALSLYRKGQERLNDKIEIETSYQRGNESWQFLIGIRNEWKQEARLIHLQVKVSKPYVMKLLDADVTYQPENGNTNLEYALNTPLLSIDGEHHLEKLDKAVIKPLEDVVDIFELDFLGLLQFIKGLNFNFSLTD